jgi:hypothetical protein
MLLGYWLLMVARAYVATWVFGELLLFFISATTDWVQGVQAHRSSSRPLAR